jgi:hypothetical protein
MSLEMAHKVIVPQKKIMSRSFLISGTLIVIIDKAIDNCIVESLNHRRLCPALVISNFMNTSIFTEQESYLL